MNIEACLEWLKETKHLSELDISANGIKEYLRDLTEMSDSEYRNEVKKIHDITESAWYVLEREFLPKRTKYT